MRSVLPIGALCLLLSACASNGIYHVIEPGQTLYRIAKAYEIDETTLAKANRLDRPTALKVGQRLYIPGATRTRRVSVDPPKVPPPPVVPPPSVKVTKNKPSPAVNKPKPVAKMPVPVGRSEEIPGPRPAPGTFVWPVRGQLVMEFGSTEGKSSKGIEIAVPHGTPVTAAAAGKVIYSGSGIRGYGNLIILEHADNYFTVYGFNAKNLVAVNAFVGQGDRIALSGAPSGSKSPRLHFEIRKGKTAANPIFFLP
jgi:lipoprotein NlpD